MKTILGTLLLSIALLTSCTTEAQKNHDSAEKTAHTHITSRKDKITKSEDEWKATLTDDQYYVLREKGTERAFTGAYWDNKKSGVYKCAACKLDLFDSSTKFKSGTGWPSFYKPFDENSVGEISDNGYGMVRTEVVCARCDGHLGHVFEDGPDPTGLRYCINSVSLIFIPTSK